MYQPVTPRATRGSGQSISFYRLASRNGHQIMVRLPRAALERSSWGVGDKVNVEFDAKVGRLRLTRSTTGAFKIGGKSKNKKGDQTEGRLRWSARTGRPDIQERFITEEWNYRKTDDAIIINTKNRMHE